MEIRQEQRTSLSFADQQNKSKTKGIRVINYEKLHSLAAIFVKEGSTA